MSEQKAKGRSPWSHPFESLTCRLGIMEVSGAGTAVDASVTNYAGSSPTTVTVTTVTANDFLFAAAGGFHSGDVFAFDSAWTLDSQSNGSDGHRFSNAAGNYNLTVTVTGAAADNLPIAVVAFKSTGSPVSGSDG